MKIRTNKYLVAAVLLALVFHGSSMFFTMERTYDALIHVFFGSHYANNWFETWSESWYTGFTVLGYPPLVHQCIGLLSTIGGLKFGMFVMVLIATVLFVTGVYRFSLLITGNRAMAGYASIACVLSSSFVETLHLFGQLPSIIGISILMHSLPEIYLWLKTGRKWHLITSLSLISITVTSHHVTPIFGMVFFIFPLIGMVIMDSAFQEKGIWKKITFKVFIRTFARLFRRIVLFGMGSLAVILICILPYWINTKNNPITQVPIPHGSRDNFLEVTSSGLVFFLIPYGVLLLLFPYLFYRYYSKRYLFFGLSLTLLFVLGTGGTTPIPKLILGENAFNILTLDRFTLWASIMALPMLGEFIYRFVEGDLKDLIQNRFGRVYHRLSGGFFVGIFLFMTAFTMSLGYFRPSQPEKIDMQPLVNFLNQDQHYKWRYLPLGFGDQMAWLSAQTKASTIDGNYHSARRLPELTSRPVERLENSKFRGVEGLGSLQQFLAIPEKYHLKYIFSNDKFYDPLLYFSGWNRLQRLENGIMVWEKEGVSPLPSKIASNRPPLYQSIMWGTIPLFTVFIALLLNLKSLWIRTMKTHEVATPIYLTGVGVLRSYNPKLLRGSRLWTILITLATVYGLYQFYFVNAKQLSPENAVLAYYDAVDFKRYEDAFQLLNPDSGKSLDQYMLEISVSDGLLSSYAKLESIHTQITSESKEDAIVKTKLTWITPLKRYDQELSHSLNRISGKWYLDPTDIDLDLPSDQLFSSTNVAYYNHGRRRVSSEQTYHEDVLKQPVVEVTEARLISRDGRFHIIGEIQNTDNIPAIVNVKANLYDPGNNRLVSYNARDIMKHTLMPKEKTFFRIDFEEYLWNNKTSVLPSTYNPDQFTDAQLMVSPVHFDLHVETNVSTSAVKNDLAVLHLKFSQNQLEGTLYNAGNRDATVPQLLIAHNDTIGNLTWVDAQYLSESIRIQRKQRFSISTNTEDIGLISSNMKDVFINGIKNEISYRSSLERSKIQEANGGPQTTDDDTRSIELLLNYYTGSPKT